MKTGYQQYLLGYRFYVKQFPNKPLAEDAPAKQQYPDNMALPSRPASSTLDLSHTAFSKRLRSLSEAIGGPSGLARVSGVAQSTIQYHLKRGEPTRPMLIAYAKASDMSLEKLLTGFEDPRCTGVEELAREVTDADGEPGNRFIDRLSRLLEAGGGKEKTAARTGVSLDRIASLLSGEEPTRSELFALGYGAESIVFWLVSGLKPRPAEIRNIRDQGGSRIAITGSEGNDGALSNSLNHKSLAVGSWKPLELASTVNVCEKVLGRLPPGEYQVFEVPNNEMAPKITVGDIAILRRTETFERPGFYLLSKEAIEFLAHVTPIGTTVVMQIGDQKTTKYSASELKLGDGLRCIGMLTLVIKIP